MTEEQYRNLKINMLVYNTKLHIVKKMSTELSDPKQALSENSILGTRDLNEEHHWYASEGVAFTDIADWHYVDDDCPDWVKLQVLIERFFTLEKFVYERLR